MKARERGGGDHGSVIGREGATRKEGLDARGFAARFEGVSELCVCGDATRNENRGGSGLFSGSEGAFAKVADDGILKFADEGQRLRRAEREELVKFALAASDGGFPGGDFGRVFGMFAHVI